MAAAARVRFLGRLPGLCYLGGVAGVNDKGSRPGLRVIRGEGQRREEPLKTQGDVVRLLLDAACELMLKRISPDRAHEIQRRVDRILRLFERVPADPVATALLRRELDDLETLWREGELKRARR